MYRDCHTTRNFFARDLLVTFGLLLGLACGACGDDTSNDDEPPDDPPEGRCSDTCGRDAGSPFEFGTLVNGQIEPLQGAQQLHYGPQGGQHFYVDVRLWLAYEDDAKLNLRMVDEDGATLGIGRWTEEIEDCTSDVEAIPVIMSSDEPVQGTLQIEVELDECSWQLEIEDLSTLPP